MSNLWSVCRLQVLSGLLSRRSADFVKVCGTCVHPIPRNFAKYCTNLHLPRIRMPPKRKAVATKASAKQIDLVTADSPDEVLVSPKKQPRLKKTRSDDPKNAPKDDGENGFLDSEPEPAKKPTKGKKDKKVKEPEEEKADSAKKPSKAKKATPAKEEDEEVPDEPDAEPVKKSKAKKGAVKEGEVEKKGKAKKEENPKKKSSDEEVEEKPAAKRGRHARAAKEEPAKKEAKKTAAKEEENGETSNKKRGGAKQPDEGPQKKKEMLNQTTTDWTKINFTTSRKNAKDEKPNLHILAWNVDGLRAWLKKDGGNIFKYSNADIICLQETKCSVEKLPEEIEEIEGYEAYWCSSNKEGYAGVALFSKTKPLDVQYGIGIKEHDDEGRCIMAEYEEFYFINVYVPNAGRGLVTLPKRMDWNEAFKNFIKKLDAQKPIILCGDMNVAHNEIDLANPKSNQKNAGFTKEEREGMTDFLNEGFVDTFRHFYPEQTGAYTFWSYMSKARSKNVGWRLDYFIVSERVLDNVCDNLIHDQVFGSDHCPISLYLHF